MKNLFYLFIFLFAMNSCSRNESETFSVTEKNENFISKYHNNENLVADLKNSGLDVNKINNIELKTDGKDGIILNVTFVTNGGNTKNIIYTNSKLQVKVENGLLVKNNQSSKILPGGSGTIKYWCADCDNCFVQWDIKAGLISCSKSCCALYIEPQ